MTSDDETMRRLLREARGGDAEAARSLEAWHERSGTDPELDEWLAAIDMNVVLDRDRRRAFVFVDGSGGSHIRLPGARFLPFREVTVKKVDSGPTVVSIAAEPGWLIDGAHSYQIIERYASVTFVSDRRAGCWWVV